MAELFTAVGLIATLHGFMGLVFLVSYSGAVVLLSGFVRKNIRTLKYAVGGMTLSIWITSFTGLFTYIFYRATGPESARSRLLAGDFPWLHEVAFEFKEHAGMYPPIIMAVAALLVWHYGDKVFYDEKIKRVTVALLTLSFLVTLLVFGLGALITKVESV